MFCTFCFVALTEIVDQKIIYGCNFEGLYQTYHYSKDSNTYAAYTEFDFFSDYKQVFQLRSCNFFFIYAEVGYKTQHGESVLSYSDSMIVNGVPYLEVYCMCKYDFSSGNEYYFYWAKNIGLIKKSDTTGVWELVDYKVH